MWYSKGGGDKRGVDKRGGEGRGGGEDGLSWFQMGSKPGF